MRHSLKLLAAVGLGLVVAAGSASANRGPVFGEEEAAENAEDVNPNLVAAEAAIDGGEYEKALRLLEDMVADEPENADAWNLMGYSHRKLQNFDRAFEHYHKALAIDPDHRNAHEYIGEAYLEVGDLEKAEEHLDRLGLICILGCDQYDQLEEKVEMYRANHTS